MGSQLGQQAGTQSPKGMSVIDLEVELLCQLTIDRLDDLPNRVESATDGFRQLVGLVATRQGREFQAIVTQQLACQFNADIAFVAKDGQIRVFGQQFRPNCQIGGMGGCQLKVQDQSTQTDQQMQFEAE